MLKNTIFLCPVCKHPLEENEKGFVCENSHNFDKAKQGYVNLLMSNKQSNHGDDKLMVEARQTFLEKGYYSQMRECVNNILGNNCVVLDAGCGEGYYTGVFSENNTVYGIDISKEALKRASAKCKKASFAVASIYDLPIADQSVDAVVNIFSPDSRDEIIRVIKNGGRFINVTPMENHLYELKMAVYEKPYKNKYVNPERTGFIIKSQTEVKYKVLLESNTDIVSLFKMTPYYYNTSFKDTKKLDGYNNMEVTLEFLITEYQKN